MFARFKALSVPLSISGIVIDYNVGTIDTRVPDADPCVSCEANRDKLVPPDQPKVSEEFENCYFYPIQAGPRRCC